MDKVVFFIFLQLLLSCNSKGEEDRNKADTIYGLKDTNVASSNDDQLELCGRAQISKSDSVFWVSGEIKCDYRIFGYSAPDINSEKLILFSVFTKDVEKNPYKCSLGAHYDSNAIAEVRYIKDTGKFVKTRLLSNGKSFDVFFLKTNVEFTDN
jgi:hypothetical protein